jgi:hypothetical protein
MKILLIAGFVLLGFAAISDGRSRSGTTCLHCAFDNEQGCFQVPDGLYQSCSDCSRYLRCQGGQRTERNQCNNGWFSTSEQKCKPPVNGCCGCYCENPFPGDGPTTTTTTTTTTTQPTTKTPSEPVVCSSTGSHCITAAGSSCAGLPDGDYQACEGCTYYHSCVAGYINYSFRPCPLTDWGGLRGRLIWQRAATDVYNNGTCERTSWSCAECNDVPPPIQPSPCYNTGSGCISSSPSACRGLPDGDYQACEGCTFYHSCVAGYLNYAYRDCPLTNYGGLRGKLVWQRKAGVYNEGTCEYSSSTCSECVTGPTNPPPTVTPAPTAVPPTQPSDCYNTGSGCISGSPSACRGLPDGDYQACEGCTFYHSCVAGYLNYARRDCPLTNYGGLRGKLVWQRKAGVYNEGTCEYSSSTCSECIPNPPEPIPTSGPTVKPTLPPTVVPDPRPCPSTGPNCIPNEVNACKDLPDGDYQACEDCTIFYKCSNYAIYTFDCPLTNYGGLRGKLVWQQWTPNTGRCERESTSCEECDEIYPRPPTEPTTPAPGPITTTPGDDNDIWTPCTSTGSDCLAGFPGACRGRADGHYQACEGCTMYHSCSGGVLYSSRMCPLTYSGGLRGRLVWKQLTATAGICDYSSNTCTECAPDPPTPTPPGSCTEFPRCVGAGADCREEGLPDGDYQICQSCEHYLSCRNGETWRCRQCPSYNDQPWKWRITSPTQGYCTNSSNTCNQCPLTSSKNKVSQKEAFDIEARLLLLAMKRKSTCLYGNANSCSGQPSGDYQACESCSLYHSCSGGVIYANRQCPAGLFWQATAVNEGSCQYTSSSCPSKSAGKRRTIENRRRNY